MAVTTLDVLPLMQVMVDFLATTVGLGAGATGGVVGAAEAVGSGVGVITGVGVATAAGAS